MPTAFRETATAPDSSGRYRTWILMAWRKAPGHTWSDSAIAAQVAASPRPCKGLELSDSEYERLEGRPELRCGYVDAPGDIDSDFEPCAWESV